jgi:hypothetical protein
MTRSLLRSGSQHRGLEGDADNYVSSGIEEYSNAVHASNHVAAPSHLKSSYLYSKPTQIDEYGSTYSRGSSSVWKPPRFTTVDLDDEDLPVKSSSNRYSGYYGTSCK